MKITIFSDSHGDVDIMCRAVDKEMPDMIIHLGDYVRDAQALQIEYPDIQVYNVPGNRDKASSTDVTEWMTLCGRSFMLTHGHIFKVKSGTLDLFKYGVQNGADIILFGHTHEAFIRCRNGRWMMNPGRIGRQAGIATDTSYGILNISADNIRWEFQVC